ncbi:MAG: thiosulfate oxidation carrier complex protein SoxZ [Gammaproteobacteria bacterium]|nr:thiosulfate oxidation carrier complex protein SoxZ [Gammaproteobacteria bacterium]
MSSIRIVAKVKSDGVCEFKALMKHPMETGLRKDPASGEIVPAHFIREVVCKHGDKVILNANFGITMSKDPVISFHFKGAKAGDKVALSWVDNKGESESEEGEVK